MSRGALSSQVPRHIHVILQPFPLPVRLKSRLRPVGVATSACVVAHPPRNFRRNFASWLVNLFVENVEGDVGRDFLGGIPKTFAEIKDPLERQKVIIAWERGRSKIEKSWK